MSAIHDSALLALLQLVSPALPVGAYSYSEGLETLVEKGVIANCAQLQAWLEQELRYGTIRLEAAIMVRAQTSFASGDLEALDAWNVWLSAARETLELRQQSWQMGQSLLKLLVKLQPQLQSVEAAIDPCNWSVAFGIAAAQWQINSQTAVIGYLQSWATNFVNAGVKLIPLGQTAGQQLLFGLQTLLIETTQSILVWEDEQLESCGWGLALASMAHEIQYTRLFRS